MANLAVNMMGIDFKNPIIPASGAFGFGREYETLYSIEELGGISLKGTTLELKDGNLPPRVAETPAGMLNSVGLQNKGIRHLIEEELPYLATKNVVKIANVAGSTVEDCIEIARQLEQEDGKAIDIIELNISCPNVKCGGVAFGVQPKLAGEVTKAVRDVTSKPLMVKLTPNVTDITEIARAVEANGADGVSLINTVLGMRIDINNRRPILRNNVGGLSGPAVFPIAVRMVWQVANAVKIPVSGMGGIATYKDVIEMMLAGATTVQIGAELFSNPKAPIEIVAGLHEWLDKNNIKDINEIIGQVQPW